MKPFTSRPLNSIETYIYGLKSRANLQHCLGHAMFPVDATELTAMRKRYSKQVRPVTKTSILIKAVALAIRANPSTIRILFQRLPFRRRIVNFDVIDVNVPITRIIDGEQLTFIGVIRGADKLSIAEIQDELTHLRRDPLEQSAPLQKLAKLKKSPPFVATIYHWLMSRIPSFYLKNAGTCGVVPMEAITGGHFFPIGPTTTIFGIGGIGDQVVAENGVPIVKRMLQVSLSLDNYVVSGPEGRALCVTLQKLLESCSFVRDEIESQGADPR